MYKSTATLRYGSGWRLTAEVDQEIADYYRSLIPPWLPKQPSRWPAHVTVVRTEKEVPKNVEFWGKHEGQVVDFVYDPIVRMGKIYYWLNIYCQKFEKIREELGLPTRSQYTIPPEGFKKAFHMTIGNQKVV